MFETMCLRSLRLIWRPAFRSMFANSELAIVATVWRLRLQLRGAIYRPDSFVSMLSYFANLKAIRYESTSSNRIVADKSQRVIVA